MPRVCRGWSVRPPGRSWLTTKRKRPAGRPHRKDSTRPLSSSSATALTGQSFPLRFRTPKRPLPSA
eukprot:14625954-Alexandrium_andersonii.AAC.1